MTLHSQQLLAGIALGGAMATALVVAVPQIVAGQPAPAIVVIAAPPEAAPVDSTDTDTASVDMNHWQETAATAPSPYSPGPQRKK